MALRQSLAGMSKCVSSLTGVTSGLNGSPLPSAAVGRPASMAFQARSMVWLPMSPTWPLATSQYIFHCRQFAPGAAGKVAGVIRRSRRRAEPQVVVQVLGRLAFGRQVPGPGKLAVAPGADLLELTNGAVADELAHAVEVLKGGALGADLRGQLVLVLEIIGADRASFLDAVGQRFLAIDVFAAVHRPIGHEGVRVIGRAAHDRFDVLLLQTLTPVHVVLRVRELLGGKGQMLLVHVAEGDDVLAGDAGEMDFAATPGADQGDVQLVAGGICAEKPDPGKDERCCGRKSDGSKEVASFHVRSLNRQWPDVKRVLFSAQVQVLSLARQPVAAKCLPLGSFP